MDGRHGHRSALLWWHFIRRRCRAPLGSRRYCDGTSFRGDVHLSAPLWWHFIHGDDVDSRHADGRTCAFDVHAWITVQITVHRAAGSTCVVQTCVRACIWGVGCKCQLYNGDKMVTVQGALRGGDTTVVLTLQWRLYRVVTLQGGDTMGWWHSMGRWHQWGGDTTGWWHYVAVTLHDDNTMGDTMGCHHYGVVTLWVSDTMWWWHYGVVRWHYTVVTLWGGDTVGVTLWGGDTMGWWQYGAATLWSGGTTGWWHYEELTLYGVVTLWCDDTADWWYYTVMTLWGGGEISPVPLRRVSPSSWRGGGGSWSSRLFNAAATTEAGGRIMPTMTDRTDASQQSQGEKGRVGSQGEGGGASFEFISSRSSLSCSCRTAIVGLI